MIRRKIKWSLFLLTPFILFMLPFMQGKNLKKVILKPKKTGITTFNFYDLKRERPVITEVWYPVDPHTPASTACGIWLRCDEARNAPLSDQQKQYPLII